MAMDGRDGLVCGAVDVEKLKAEEWVWRSGVMCLGEGGAKERDGRESHLLCILLSVLIHFDTACDHYH